MTKAYYRSESERVYSHDDIFFTQVESLSLDFNLSELMKSMVEGEGYAIGQIPFNDDIHNATELAAVAMAIIEKAEKVTNNDKGFMPINGMREIFEHAIIDENGYIKDLQSSFDAEKEAHRFQTKVERPLQPASTKTLVDNSPESRIYRFMEHVVNTELNAGSDVRYVVYEINIVKTLPSGREQPRHHDFAAYHDPELTRKPNCSFMLPINDRAHLNVWEGSHKLVHAENKLVIGMVPPASRYSHIRKAMNGKMKFVKEQLVFGTDEYCAFLDCLIHSGAASYNTERPTYRLHAYVVRMDASPSTLYTHIPSALAWDLTRDGAESSEMYYEPLQEELEALEADTPTSSIGGKKKKNRKTVAEMADEFFEHEETAVVAKKRGRPRKS